MKQLEAAPLFSREQIAVIICLSVFIIFFQKNIFRKQNLFILYVSHVKFKILNSCFLLKNFHESFMMHQHIFQTMYGYDSPYSVSHVVLYWIAVTNTYSHSEECKFVVIYKQMQSKTITFSNTTCLIVNQIIFIKMLK